MRTTVDLPEDLHRGLLAMARDHGQTLSRTVADLLRSALSPSPRSAAVIDERTGLPVISTGTIITSEDVRSLDDDT